MRRIIVTAILFVSVASPAFAQRDSDSTDRLGRRDLVERAFRNLEAVAPPPTNNLYLKVAATHSDGPRT